MLTCMQICILAVAGIIDGAAPLTTQTSNFCKQIPEMGTYCGVRCVYVISQIHGASIDWKLSAKLVQPDSKGESQPQDLIRAFMRLKMVPIPVRCSLDELARLKVPAVLHLNGKDVDHFIVCTKAESDRALIVNFPRPPEQLRRADLESSWSGIALLVYPNADAVPASLKHGQLNLTESTRSDHPTEQGNEIRIGSLVCSRPVLDYGTIGRYKQITGRFTIRNTSQKTIRLISVKSSCDCASIFRIPGIINPSESSTIEFKLDTSDQVGRQDKQLLVSAEEASVISSGELHIKYNLLKDLFVTPSKIDFGSVNLSGPNSQTLEIINTSRGSGRMLTVNSSLPFVKASQPAYFDRYNLESAIDLNISPEAPAGSFEGLISIVFEGAEKYPLDIPVAGNVLPLIQARPKTLIFGVVNPGQTINKAIILACPGRGIQNLGSPIITVDGQNLAVRLKHNDSTRYELNAELTVPTHVSPDVTRGTIMATFPGSDIRVKIPYAFSVTPAVPANP